MQRRNAVFLSALMACVSAPVAAATFCVSNSAEFQTALQLADSNADVADVIRLRTGTYLSPAGGFGRNQIFAGSESLTIEGGWLSLVFPCDLQLKSAAETVIDGANSNPGLIINRLAGSGGTTIRRLTVTRGLQAGDTTHTDRGGGIAVFTSNETTGPTVIENVVLSDNHAGNLAGGAYVGGGVLTLRSNLFVGNSAPTSAALYTISNGALVHVANNTLTQNNPLAPGASVFGRGGNSSVFLSNNILWNNLGQDLGAEGITLVSNIVQTLGGSPGPNSSSNLALDPQFVSASDFRLRNDSPAINTGTDTPSGGLGALDITGFARVHGTHVDRGAHESDRGFANGFE